MKHAIWILVLGLLAMAGCGAGPMPPELHEYLGYQHNDGPLVEGPANMIEEFYSEDGTLRYAQWWQVAGVVADEKDWIVCPTDVCRKEGHTIWALKSQQIAALVDGKWVDQH